MPVVDRTALAEVLSVTPGRVTQLCHAGVLSKLSRGRYDLNQCVQAFVKFKVERATAINKSTDVNVARKRLYDAQTHKVELENDRTRRETIPADEFMIDMLAVEKIFSSALDELENTLASALAGLNTPAAISDRIREATTAVRTVAADNIEAYAATVEG